MVELIEILTDECMSEPIATVSKIYSDVLEHKPSEYWDYENFNPHYDNIENYALLSKLSSGRYGDVFEGVDDRTKENCVVKVLKPINSNRIKREIRVLEELNGEFNVIKLKAVVLITPPQTALIFEHVNAVSLDKMCLDLSEFEVRYYIYELLTALNYCHSKGIMHRDVKPQNIIVNRIVQKLHLIDWGLAEFYHRSHEYNVHVASRYYKSPELLLDYKYYDYSMDMWSLGCIFACMIFRRHPFFKGSDNIDQLKAIIAVLGTNDLITYMQKYNIKLPERFELRIRYKMPWEQFINTENEHLVNVNALNLLDQMLRYDHTARITALEAMEHQYFKPVLLYQKNQQRANVEGAEKKMGDCEIKEALVTL